MVSAEQIAAVLFLVFVLLHLRSEWLSRAHERETLRRELAAAARRSDEWERLALALRQVAQAGIAIGERRAPASKPAAELYDGRGGILFPGKDHPGSAGSGSAYTQKMSSRQPRPEQTGPYRTRQVRTGNLIEWVIDKE